MTEEGAKVAWQARMLDDDEVQDALENETWEGVAIGFFMGCGFSLSAAIALSSEVEF